MVAWQTVIMDSPAVWRASTVPPRKSGCVRVREPILSRSNALKIRNKNRAKQTLATWQRVSQCDVNFWVLPRSRGRVSCALWEIRSAAGRCIPVFVKNLTEMEGSNDGKSISRQDKREQEMQGYEAQTAVTYGWGINGAKTALLLISVEFGHSYFVTSV